MPTTRAPESLPLPGANEAHVWSFFLPEASSRQAVLEQLLSAEEKQTAGRFLRPEDRARCVAARGTLRELLGRYLATAPAGLAFAVNPHGKPELVREAGRPPLAFNLAHSGQVVLFAVTTNRRVGVDVEAIRTDVDVLELARSQFAPEETETLQATPGPDRTGAFFRCWTRKEAYLKARGEGLGIPLKQFAVAFGPDELPGVRWAADDASAADRWSMFDLVPAPGYAGAVVVEGRPVDLAIRRWA